MNSVLAFDIGGTYLRYAVVKDGTIVESKKEMSPSFVHFQQKSPQQLLADFIEILSTTIKDVLQRCPSLAITAIAMPGIVTDDGVVLTAPPLWGNLLSNIPLQDIIQEKTNLKTVVFNDLCGISLFYSELPEFNSKSDFLCLITLSTGIGCKIVDLKRKQLIMDSFGRCGEIGHIIVDYNENALPCDCGGKGHLSSYLSGRGIVRLLKQMAKIHPENFQNSKINLNANDEIIAKSFSNAIKVGDSFASKVLNFATEKLAKIIQIISGTIGVDRYVLIGGLSFALNEALISSLNHQIKEIGIFGWNHEKIESLFKIGIQSDDFGLLGAVKYCLLRHNNKT